MTRSEIIRSLQEEYARRREGDLRAREERARRAYEMDPALEALDREKLELFSRQARGAMGDPDEAARLAGQIRKRIADIRREQEERLIALGLKKDYLDPAWQCPLCRDSGYVGEGVREMCACFERELAGRVYESARERGADGQRFETFREDIFPEERAAADQPTQRQIAAMARDICMKYADRYPDTGRSSLLITGGTGLGKTFLINCVANRLNERGFAPAILTAYRLFEVMRGAHFGEEERRNEFEELIRCDILVIDDLGTEPMLKNVTREYMFTLLNERMSRKKHTLAATNLDQRELQEQYGERVLSRLFDTSNVWVLRLQGRDLRTLRGGFGGGGL